MFLACESTCFAVDLMQGAAARSTCGTKVANGPPHRNYQDLSPVRKNLRFDVRRDHADHDLHTDTARSLCRIRTG